MSITASAPVEVKEHRDAELLAVCAKLREQAEAWQQLYAATPDDFDGDDPSLADEELDAYSDAVWPGFSYQGEADLATGKNLVGMLAIMPASTEEGRQARAAVALAVADAEDYLEGRREDLLDIMMLVMRDAAGHAAMQIGAKTPTET